MTCSTPPRPFLCPGATLALLQLQLTPSKLGSLQHRQFIQVPQSGIEDVM